MIGSTNAGIGINDTVVDSKIEAAKTELRTEINAKYTKPTSGIPSSDMASAVQTSLGKADAAIPNPTTKADKQALIYNATSGKWEAGTIGGFVVSTTQPQNTNVLWINPTPVTGGLMYHNGTAWVTVPVRYSAT